MAEIESQPPFSDASMQLIGKRLRIATYLLWLGIVLVLSLTAIRTYRQYHHGGAYDASHGGMSDFHNGAYYPAMAIRDGVSPYGSAFHQQYPVAKPIPAFSPSIVAIHIPLTCFSQRTADVIYFVLSFAIFGLIAWIATNESASHSALIRSNRCFRSSLFAFLFLFIVASRGGHTTLLNGYFTPIIVLGTQLAFQYSNRLPWLAGLGILLASGKPTFAIPMGIILLARGNYKALTIGVVLALLGGILPAWWLASHSSWSDLFGSLNVGQKLHMEDPRELPLNSWTRIDLSAIAAKWSGTNPSEVTQLIAMLPLITFPLIALHRRRLVGDSEGTVSCSGTIGLLALLVTLYHHVYDALVLIGPIGMIASELVLRFLNGKKTKNTDSQKGAGLWPWSEWSSPSLILFAILLSSPLWNYFSSEILLIRLPKLPWLQDSMTSFNAIALTISLALLVMSVMQESHRTVAKVSPTDEA